MDGGTGRWLKRSEIGVDGGRTRERVGGREVPDIVVMRMLRRDIVAVVLVVLVVLCAVVFCCRLVRIATGAGDDLTICSRVASIGLSPDREVANEAEWLFR